MNKIENQHQLDITERWLKSHLDSLEALKKEKGSMNKLLYQLHHDATKSMVEDLQEQIKIYKETSSQITFKDLVQHGEDSGANIVAGMPWSFSYKGMPVTHENDNEYLITTPKNGIIKLNVNCVLYIVGDHVYVK